MSAAAPYVMNDREIAWGYLPGLLPDPYDVAEPVGDPRRMLEEVILEAVRRPPCGVAFSGGRDSSTVLAVAAHVARREGLPAPIPITKRYPDAPQANEDEWQELVVRHLGLGHWERLDFSDEMDLIGPVAERHLRRHGVVWPPLVYGDVPMFERVSGGSLLNGEGGDDVLGAEFHRIAPLTGLRMNPRRLSRSRARHILAALAPRSVRRSRIRRELAAASAPWLRPAAEDPLIEALLGAELARPLRFDRSVRDVPRRRSQVLLARNRERFAREYRTRVLSPLLHPRVVAALARSGGWLGPGGRSDALRTLVPDLLPDAVLTRTSKALFNDAVMNVHSRHFIARWTGVGLDDELVDAEILLDSWRAGNRSARTFALLQAAWLATAPGSPPTSEPERGRLKDHPDSD